MLPCPACRGELTCWTSQQENQNWNLICFFFFAHFHYFITVWNWCFMKWTSSAQRNVQISKNNVADPLPPALLSWIPFFCYFWLPFFHLSPQTYQYSVATSSVFPNSTYYSPVILPRPLLKPWFLYSLLINIAFTFMPVFAITAIVFKGQKGMEVKLQNLGILGIRNSPEFWVLVLGFSFMNTVIVLDIIWISPRVSSFH